jgi:hypothetical protein
MSNQARLGGCPRSQAEPVLPRRYSRAIEVLMDDIDDIGIVRMVCVGAPKHLGNRVLEAK